MPTQEETRREQQREIDFSTRGARLRLLDRVQFPQSKGTLPSTMKAVLRSIDSHAREKPTWRMTVKELADEVVCDRATIYRALAVLRSLAVLDVIRSGRASIYRIVWSNLADFDTLDDEEGTDTAATGHTAAELSAISEQRSARADEPAPCDIRSRNVRHQKSQRATSEVAICDIVNSAPLSANEPPPPRLSSVAAAAGWEEVEGILRDEFQIGRSAACIAECQRRGEAAAAALAAIDEFREAMRVERFASAGALVWRLTSGVWPPPSAAFAKAQARAVRAQAAAHEDRQRAEAERIDAEARAAQASLEATWGPALDALDREALAQLVETAFAGNEFMQRHFRREPASSLGREALLAHLAASAETAAHGEGADGHSAGSTAAEGER